MTVRRELLESFFRDTEGVTGKITGKLSGKKDPGLTVLWRVCRGRRRRVKSLRQPDRGDMGKLNVFLCPLFLCSIEIDKQ
jgi:hypothetical protein